MIDQETFESGKTWCQLGVEWIEKGAVPTGMKYLDQAIAVFEEVEDPRWLTFARHQKLQALLQAGRDEEAEALAEDVLQGYIELDDPYGKALALAHVATATARLGRWERAMARLHLATAVAEADGQPDLLAFILGQRARLYAEHTNYLQAVRLYRRAEAMLGAEGRHDEAGRQRLAAAEILVNLGEQAEAIALLEDVQAYFFRHQRYRDALQPLSLLNRLYESARMWDDKNRISEMIHFCGQYILHGHGEGAVATAPRMPAAPR